MTTIFKLQRSLSTSNETQQVLIYNKSKTIVIEQNMTDEFSKVFGQKLKFYAKGSFKNKVFSLGPAVKAQGW